MKFVIKKTEIQSNKSITNSNIIGISDLHYTESLTPLFLDKLNNKIASLNPTYICFLGDLCDDYSYDDIIVWLNNLSKIAPIYFILGNHDILKYSINDKIYRVKPHLPAKFLSDIKNIDNLNLLKSNQMKVDNGFSFLGTKFYHDSNYHKYIRLLNHNIPNLNEENFNILLSHNPLTIDPNIFNELDNEYKKNIDLVFSGHSHNGLVTSTMDKILPGNRGFYLKSKGLFPSYTRGVFDSTKNETEIDAHYTGVVCPPLTTIPDRNIIYRNANKLIYNPSIQLIRVKKSDF